MRIYNLFRRADRVELVCAVPEDRPVPDFVQGPAWQFGGRVEGAAIGSSRFNREAAEASVRYNGFYFFQLINASDLQFRADQGGAERALHKAPIHGKDFRREIRMDPDRRRAAAERISERRAVWARVLEQLSDRL
jgi:hypothetical protein